MQPDDQFWKGAAVNVFRIVPGILQGAYPSEAAVDYLRNQGVSAILNVSGGTVASAAGFECLAVPFPDGQPIPDAAIARSLRFIARCRQAGKVVFVHCSAGQNRSPTIIWLYLIHTGMTPEQATRAFAGRTLDGVPGHPKLAGPAQVRFAREMEP